MHLTKYFFVIRTEKFTKAINQQDYPESNYPKGAVCAINRDVLIKTKQSTDPYDYFLSEWH